MSVPCAPHRPRKPTTNDDPAVIEVAVPSADHGYRVFIGAGQLAWIGERVRCAFPRATAVAVVSDENVSALYASEVCDAVAAVGLTPRLFVVAAGEPTKSPDRLLALLRDFKDAGLSRADAVVALGGGVVGDLAGLAAALFKRGLGFVQVPTSLLAQVDASVGGKVAVHLDDGKNLLGTFHFPRAVLVDPVVLRSLPEAELRSGLAEMLKHGALFSPPHFDALVAAADAVFARDSASLAPLIAASVALKAACVGSDPYESSTAGGRIVLNLGHTLGHAIEAASHWEIRHGEAVALGMRAAARISERQGIAECGLEARIVAALERLRLPVDLERWLGGREAVALERALVHDKKGAAGIVSYIGLVRIGEARVLPLKVGEILGLLRTG